MFLFLKFYITVSYKQPGLKEFLILNIKACMSSNATVKWKAAFLNKK